MVMLRTGNSFDSVGRKVWFIGFLLHKERSGFGFCRIDDTLLAFLALCLCCLYIPAGLVHRGCSYTYYEWPHRPDIKITDIYLGSVYL